LAQAARTVDTPPELQKPKAEQTLTRVNFQTPEQRLIDQIAVPQDTNEEAAVAAHLSKMDLAGVLIIADAAHTVKANCRQITQMLPDWQRKNIRNPNPLIQQLVPPNA
jgi:phage gp29-like protein